MSPLRQAGFIRRRWRGEAPLHTLFWRDILGVGSLLNLFNGFASLMLVAKGADPLLAAAVHFAMLPYNVFLVAALWRTPQRSRPMAWACVVWLVVMTLV